MNTFKFLIIALLLTSISSVPLRFLQAASLKSVLGSLGSTGFNAVLGKVNMIVGMWRDIATTFSTKITNVMEKYLRGMGFNKLEGSCTYQFKIGLDLDKYKEFAKVFLRKNNVPLKYVEQMAQAITDASYTKEQVVADIDILFNKDSTNNDKVDFMHLMSWRDKKAKKITLIYTHSNLSFKLAPDVIVMRKTKSIAGGAYVTSEPHDILEPKSLTHDDLDMIMKFFTYSAVRMFAMALGIDAPAIGPK